MDVQPRARGTPETLIGGEPGQVKAGERPRGREVTTEILGGFIRHRQPGLAALNDAILADMGR